MHTKINEQLKKAGFETTAQGDISYSGAAKKIYDHWCKLLKKTFAEKDTLIYSNPLTIDEKTLDTSKYSVHFPHQLINVVPREKGKSIACCTPASCLHIYPHVQQQEIDRRKTYLVQGTCARFEGGKWKFPFRLAFFTMLEYVVIGTEAEVKEEYDRVLSVVEKMFTKSNIRGEFKFATDAFFLAGNEGAQLIQKLKGLKKEYIGMIDNKPIALASLNYHEDYFGKNFSIKRNALPAFSTCIAFGIDRLTAYSLLAWGDKNNWPAEFQYE